MPPLAWDEHTIDDPQASPRRADGPVGVDPVAVARACSGELPAERLNCVERVAAIRQLAAAGCSDAEIGRRLHIADRTALRLRSANGIPASRKATGKAA